MKPWVIVSAGLGLVGCTAWRDGCNYPQNAPDGRKPDTETRCAATPIRGVRRVTVKFHEPAISLYPGGSFNLSKRDEAEILDILSRASYLPGGQDRERRRVEHKEADFSIIVFWRQSGGRNVPVRLKQVDLDYGPELANWIRRKLPNIIDAEKRSKPARQSRNELSPGEHAAMLRRLEASQKYIPQPNGEYVLNPNWQKDKSSKP